MLKLSKAARLIPIFGVANHEFTHWVQTCPQTLAPVSNLQINSPNKQQNKFIKQLLWEYKMIPQLELENIVRQGGHLYTIARSACVMLNVLNSMVFNFTLKPSPPSAKKEIQHLETNSYTNISTCQTQRNPIETTCREQGLPYLLLHQVYFLKPACGSNFG
jgi:hypothetical protein